MGNQWLEKLAQEVENEYGKDVSERIFGDISRSEGNHESVSKWFENFTSGMDELGNKNFFTDMLAKNCPCDNGPANKDIKNLYKDSKSHEEFVTRLDKSGWWGDKIELRGNVLYTTKYPWNNYGKHNHKGRYSHSCHCSLGSHAEEPVSDIFCHCCTVGYYGNIFKTVFGVDVKVEFIDSIIVGGTECKAAIHLPENQK